jgi:hypothetical protein
LIFGSSTSVRRPGIATNEKLGEIRKILFDVHCYKRISPEMLNLSPIFCGKKIHEFAIEYVKERCNVRVAISSESDAAYALLVDDHIVL